MSADDYVPEPLLDLDSTSVPPLRQNLRGPKLLQEVPTLSQDAFQSSRAFAESFNSESSRRLLEAVPRAWSDEASEGSALSDRPLSPDARSPGGLSKNKLSNNKDPISARPESVATAAKTNRPTRATRVLAAIPSLAPGPRTLLGTRRPSSSRRAIAFAASRREAAAWALGRSSFPVVSIGADSARAAAAWIPADVRLFSTDSS